MLQNRAELVIVGLLVFAGGILVGFQMFGIAPEYDQVGSVGSAVIRPRTSAISQPATNTIAPVQQNDTQSVPPTSATSLSNTTSANPKATISPLVGLTLGTKSLAVRDLQNRLGSLGFFEGEATGYFGPVTARALTQFQKNNNLPLVSIVSREVAALLPSYSNQLSSGGSCTGPVYAGTSAWPPHGPNNPTPPYNPVFQHPPYTPGVYECKDFSRSFCDAYNSRYPNSCQIMTFDDHAISRIVFTDSSGQVWACYVEPQTGESVCRPGDNWNNDEKSWIKDVLCRQIYREDQAPNCDHQPLLHNLPLVSCASIVGSSCQPTSGQKMCVDGLDTLQDVSCRCNNNGYNCSWQIIDNPPNPPICPDSHPQHSDDELVPYWKNHQPICYYAEPVFVPQDNQ